MQYHPQIHEMLHNIREDELRRISPHRIDALSAHRASAGLRASVGAMIVRAGLVLGADACAIETACQDAQRRLPRLPTVSATEGDPAWHW